MEIGNNTSTFGYSVDYFSRANAQQQAVSNDQGIEQDIRSVEKDEASNQTNNNQEQTNQSQTTQNSTELTSEEKSQLNELKAVDAKVRAHEAAHQSGPAAVGGASYTYAKGPDGVMYAVAGEVPVQIETSSEPQETISNLQGVIATALAPADPSPQDISIASKARVLMMKAQQEFAQETQEKIVNSDEYSQNAKNQYEQNSNSKAEDKAEDIIA
ncbi:putative metalloprotease CJM1_0395 family protein [Halarcobacter anaerophilus]|uniref:putative metalloprotease CJM1_0395 family protein n=1 Tax=Halarcobacter anaerophilus TaxID=877500 RepID=UPI0005C9972F|nr:putative metalloprotease CJM1_0395 family protein [Halarcobacter anaerophilus]